MSVEPVAQEQALQNRFVSSQTPRRKVEHRVPAWGVLAEADAPSFAPMPAPAGKLGMRRRVVRSGSQIFDRTMPLANAYTVASGEVLILREGRVVDIVEPGELLDPRIWTDATAVALTDCTLAPQVAAV